MTLHCTHSAFQYDTQYWSFCDESSNVGKRLSFKGENEITGSVETTALIAETLRAQKLGFFKDRYGEVLVAEEL
jgi:hypothetical protein